MAAIRDHVPLKSVPLLRDHVSSFTHYDHVAGANVLDRYLVLVMKGRHTHRGTSQNRFEYGKRRRSSGTRLLKRRFVGDGVIFSSGGNLNAIAQRGARSLSQVSLAGRSANNYDSIYFIVRLLAFPHPLLAIFSNVRESENSCISGLTGSPREAFEQCEGFLRRGYGWAIFCPCW